ncbi:SUKH-3 domain-containing protein [Streptomyces sp. NBC_00047]|uniref:SUKH-3 domain-containing protein n=1 Tax=Streptomyces sp. NBC_00047 TaxID=2975627 RepID=UPI00225463DF|nr:SUKH-3 domain-containing protein [Streptomyces sp. NBC_00047]MCX5613493.1 SUKH-3 domain-containing protein [Streptomyces sp. NBC_00047]
MATIKFGLLRQDLLEALSSSGWSPQRRVSITHWVDILTREGYRSHPLAQEVLATMGGLCIEPLNPVGPNFSNDEPFNFDPISAGAGQLALATEVESILGGTYFPVGEWLSYSSVFVEAGGRVIAAGMGWIWELGTTFEEALELAVCANRPLVCLHSDPGLDPWPPIPAS